MMFNPEREWCLMEQNRRVLTRQAWRARLAHEATRDRVSRMSRILLAFSTLLTDIATQVRARFGNCAEQPHEYITDPNDRVYS